ncbi:hypothetical protein LCGC14_1037220 [marine sediment metagenome]|uniref:Uncharacterized protein n=1 Tax=marine sediment metagenome TaxID=412755 RepID=A0A0F9QB33_9ZZZZ
MKQQVNLIQHVMKEVMKDKEHYGTIPGCGDKKSLFKSGAEKLILTFRLVPEIDVEVVELPNSHREYRTKVTIFSSNGQRMGMGVGSCSTMEGKYRYRTGEKTVTDVPVPKEYWSLRKKDAPKAQALIGEGNSTKKVGNDWFVTSGGGDKVEHDNPADYYNTCLKMSKKRGVVDAVLTVTAASDIFTQDIEDMPEVIPGAAKAAEAKPNLEESVQEKEMDGVFDKGAPVPSETTTTEPFDDQDKIDPPTEKGDISDPQRKKIYAMFMNEGVKGADNDETGFLQRSAVSEMLGFSKEVSSMNNLSKAHAKMVIDILEARK